MFFNSFVNYLSYNAKFYLSYGETLSIYISYSFKKSVLISITFEFRQFRISGLFYVFDLGLLISLLVFWLQVRLFKLTMQPI